MQEPPSTEPTTQPNAPVAEGAQGGDFNPTEWLSARTPQERAAIDEYAAFRVKPLESEKHGLVSEVGRLRKAADPAIVARLSNEERLLEQHKAAAIALYGVKAADLEDIDSVDGLNVALRFMAKAAKPEAPAKAQVPAGADPDTWAEFMAFKAQTAPAKRVGAAGEPTSNARGGAPGQFDYKEHLKSGKPLPSAEEIDRMTSQFLR